MKVDDYGRASFAILALAILLLANLSVVYAVVVQREGIELANRIIEVQTMNELASTIDDQVETAAHYMAMRAIRDSTDGPHNESDINKRFNEAFSDFIDQSFPRQLRGFTVSVDDCRVIVITESRMVHDIVATGTEVQDDDTESPDAIETGIPGPLEDSERVVYYRLQGSVNYTIVGDGASLRTREEMSSDLESPYPFIHQQLDRMAASGIGAASDIEEMLRYILTTIAQQRVLLGYAGGMYGKPYMGTFDVLTAQDVEIAVNLVLILEQLRLFRDVDDDSVNQFDTAYFSEYYGGVSSRTLIPPSRDRTLARLIRNYAGNGTLDPADIFELFTAIDGESVPMNIVLAQALYAMKDQYALKYLDYLNFLPLEFLANLGLGLMEMAANTWDGFVDWLSGNSKEAEMVRQFVDDLFNDLGFSPFVLGVVHQAIPAIVFTIANADGTVLNISIPAGNSPVPFQPRKITLGNGDLWKGYYNDVFRDDLNKLHSGFRDLVKDVASKLADKLEVAGLFQPIELNGVVDPRDNTSILEYTRERMISSIERALTGLRSDPVFFSNLVSNLWEAEKATVRKMLDCIEDNYDAFADPTASASFARNRIQDWLMSNAQGDPDYDSLDVEAVVELKGKVLQAIDSGGWALSAYDAAKRNDVARFESLFQKATALDTPPEDGGLYTRIMESLSGSTGILLQAGDYVLRFMEGLMTNEELSNNKILVPAYTQPFLFKDSVGPGASDTGGRQEEAMAVDQCPNLLTISRLTRGQGAISDSPKKGELLVDIADPSDIPATKDSPNTHFTDAINTSARPFESQWTVSLRGLYEMRVATTRGVYLDHTGLVPASDDGLIPLDVVIRVKAFSGWPLDGVAYSSSNTLGEDLWNAVTTFLDRAWKAVSSVFSWILDGARFLVHQLRNLADFLLGQAAKVLEVIHRGIDKAVHLMQEALRGTITGLLVILDVILTKLPKFELNLSAFGLSLNIVVNGNPAQRLLMRTAVGPFSICGRFTDLHLAGSEPNQDWVKWDVLIDIDAYAGPLEAHAKIDPLMQINEHVIEGSGTWGDKWRFDFEGPVLEQYYSYSRSLRLSLPLVVPLYADLELGFKLKFSERPEGIDVMSLLQQSFSEAWEDCGGMPSSREELKDCAETFVNRFNDRVLEGLDREIRKIIEVTAFIRCGVTVEEVVGGGFDLEVSVEGEGIVSVFHWLARNFGAILQRLFHPNTDIHLEHAPLDVARHMFVYAGLFFVVEPPLMLAELFPDGLKPEVTMTWLIGANIPFAAAIAGIDMGPWEIRFGVIIEGPTAIPGLFSEEPGKITDIWAIRGLVEPM